ncbi:MAG: hypothetical protein MJ068_02820 [Clostridia bacterium]|nr:hypothetical protein [Clostridia bacterium]
MDNTRQASSGKGNRIAFGILIILVSLFCFLCNVHCFGGVGRMVYGFLVGFFGLACYGYNIVGILLGIAVVINKKFKIHPGKAVFISVMYILAVLALQIYSSSSHIIDANYGEYLLNCYHFTNTAGGMLFGIVAFPLMKLITTAGSLILICGIFFLLLLLQIIPVIKSSRITDYEDKSSRDKSLGFKSGIFSKKHAENEPLLLDDVEFPSLTDFAQGEKGIIRIDVTSTAEKLSRKIKGSDSYVPLEDIKEESYSTILSEKVDQQKSYSRKDLSRDILLGAQSDDMFRSYHASTNPRSAFDGPSVSPSRRTDLMSKLGIDPNGDDIKRDFQERYSDILGIERKEPVIPEPEPEPVITEEVHEEEIPLNDDGKIDFFALKQQQMKEFSSMKFDEPEQPYEKEDAVPKSSVVANFDNIKSENDEEKVYANTGMTGAFNRASNNIEEPKPVVKNEYESSAYTEPVPKYKPQSRIENINDLDRSGYKAQVDETRMPRAFQNNEVTKENPYTPNAWDPDREEKERKIKQALSQAPPLSKYEKEAIAAEQAAQAEKPKRTRHVDPAVLRANRLEKIDPNSTKYIQTTIDEQIEAAEETEKPIRPYTYPTLDLLDPPTPPSEQDTDTEFKKKAIVDKFKEFNIESEIYEVIQGPTFTLYKAYAYVPRGKQINYCLTLESDMAMAMRVQNVRMTLLPAEGAVGIEAPNKNRRVVNFIELVKSEQFVKAKSTAVMALGQDIYGTNRVMEFDKLPHALVAGATGMGKSCCLNTLIVGLLYKSTPDDVRLILIDPKRTEFTAYAGLPNLLLDVIKDADKAIKAINWALQEMDRRQKLLESTNFRNIDEYNAACVTHGMKKMPRIIIVIDEFAELISIGKRGVEDGVNRIARLARASGIHMILATQRPSVDVIPGTIKNNFPTRVAFHVSSSADSKTVLDQGGAEKLLPRGDMLLKMTECDRLQGAFISNDEVIRVCDFIRNNNDTVYDKSVRDAVEKEEVPPEEVEQSSSSHSNEGGLSPDILESLRIGVEQSEANLPMSISILQRKLGFGYPKAGKMFDQLEKLGFLTIRDPSKPDKKYVNISREQYDALCLGESIGDDEGDDE